MRTRHFETNIWQSPPKSTMICASRPLSRRIRGSSRGKTRASGRYRQAPGNPPQTPNGCSGTAALRPCSRSTGLQLPSEAPEGRAVLRPPREPPPTALQPASGDSRRSSGWARTLSGLTQELFSSSVGLSSAVEIAAGALPHHAWAICCNERNRTRWFKTRMMS